MRLRDYCSDCGADIMAHLHNPDGKSDYYMVWDSVWAEARVSGEILCTPCLQERLGRLLTGRDYPPYPVNEYSPIDAPALAEAKRRELSDRELKVLGRQKEEAWLF